MLISYNWLCDYLPRKISADHLGNILTRIGLEIEEMQAYQSAPEDLNHLVIGHIQSINPIEGADRIRLTKVLVDKGEILDIVCGATNIVKGDTVVVAKPGATLQPRSGQGITIKQTKLKGVQSCGMICSTEEIGVDISHEKGVWILGDDAPPPGTALSDFISRYTDIIFKINITPNRSDAMNYLGIARDVCAYWSYHQDSQEKVILPKIKSLEIIREHPSISIQIKNKERCARYSGLMSGVQIEDTPLWMKYRLQSVGLNTINNVVDISNYVLHETGQPLHMFDYDQIARQAIVVETVKKKKFVTLDKQERTLHEEDLMICDAEKPLCIAGVFGGSSSGVSSATKTVFIESAYFTSQGIRQTSLRHQLRTDAAIRYEKGTDIKGTLFALQRVAHLLEAHADASVKGAIVDVCDEQLLKEKYIVFETDYVKRLTGHVYDMSKVKTMLVTLGFDIDASSDQIWKIGIPSYRSDVAYPADIVEEIVRIDGLDNIPITEQTNIFVNDAVPFSSSDLEKSLASCLCGMGFYEALHNSIVGSKDVPQAYQDNIVKLLNSLTDDYNVLRPSIMESGLASIAYNLNRKRGDIKFFEFGYTYHLDENKHFVEQRKCGLWFTGNWQAPDWKETKTQPVSFYHIAGVLDALYQSIAKSAKQNVRTRKNNAQYADFISFRDSSQEWAFSGRVKTDVLRSRGIKQEVWYAELDVVYLSSLWQWQQNQIFHKEASRFQSVVRDIAFFVSKDVAYQDLVQHIYSLNISLLDYVQLFDVYDVIENRPDERSFALRLVFRSYDKTLQDKEIKQTVRRIIDALESSYVISLRTADTHAS